MLVEPHTTPWEGRTFVYTHLTQVGERALFIQMHAQGAGIVYDRLHLQDAPAQFSLADAEALVQALRQHIRRMVDTEQQDVSAEKGDP